MDDSNVTARLVAAKLPLESVLNPSQIIKFNNKLENDDEVILVELDKSTLEYIESGKELIVRGCEKDSAVFCTKNETFDVKECKTSNSLILVDNLVTSKDNMSEYLSIDSDFQVAVIKQSALCEKSKYLELKRKIPHTSTLRDMLSKTPYKGEIEEDTIDVNTTFFSTDDLLNIIPASEAELMKRLKELEVCCVKGFWRSLDFDYVIKCMEEIFKCIDAESWSFDELDLCQLTDKINDSGEIVPDFIVAHLISVYGQVSDNGSCEFIIDKLSRFFVQMLLNDGETYELSEFMEVLSETMPQGMESKPEYLSGLSLIDRQSKPHTITRFYARDLPLNVEKRFEALFKAREKWTLEEISPYLKDLCLPGQKISSLLTRHSRSSLTGGLKLYSSRK